MPALCLCFNIHEPYQFRRYTVFDMGQSSVYEDDDRNCETMLRAARLCYLPAAEMLLRLVRRHEGAFAVSLCVSGTALDLFEQYTPEVTESLCALAATGCVEFVAETSAHSLAFLYSREEFDRQVKAQSARIKKLFGKKPTTFMHTECVFNNDLAAALQQLGFKTALAEGADQVLGWRSPNWVYRPVSGPKMNLLLRNTALSDDMGLRFGDRGWSDWPLTADKFASWCHSLGDKADVINIYNDFHVFGLRHGQDSGIFDFMSALPEALLAAKTAAQPEQAQASKQNASAAPAVEPKAHADHDEHAGHDEHGGHADMDASFTFECAQPEALHGMDVRLFSAWPALHELRVQIVSPSGQHAAELNEQAHTLKW